MAQTRTAQTFNGTAYRGYLIVPDLCGNWLFVRKGGFTIATVRTLAEAYTAVDLLTDGMDLGTAEDLGYA